MQHYIYELNIFSLYWVNMNKQTAQASTNNYFAFQIPQNKGCKIACMCSHTEFVWCFHKYHPYVKWMHRGKWHKKTTERETGKRRIRSLQKKPPIGSLLHPSGHTAMQHTTQAPNHMFKQISIQATGSSSQLLMRLWREQHRCPLWWHRLLTELKTPSFESDHCREAYCYMRGLALAKTEQQKGRWVKLKLQLFCYTCLQGLRVRRLNPTHNIPDGINN